LNVSHNTNLLFLSLAYMPTLHEVCVWEIPFFLTNVFVDTTSSPNVYFTAECLTNIQDEYKEIGTINIYPNPSDEIINIEIENSNNAVIEIYNVSGTLLIRKTFHSESEKIDISGFSRGLYIVKVKQEGTVIVKEVVKK